MEATKREDAATPDLLFRLLGTAHAVTERLDGALNELGLSTATFDILTELVSATGPVEWTEPGIEQLVEALERDGLIRRMPHASASSSVRVVITARGRARAHAAAQRVGAVRHQFAQAMEHVDCEALERALSALR